MTRKQSKSGRKILPGIWQLNQTTFIVRAQPKDPRTGKKRNFKRVLQDSSRREAIAVREELLVGVHEVRTATPTSQETVGSFAKSWLRRKAERGDIEVSTLDRYGTALGHLSTRILNSYLGEVTAADIENWMVKATQMRRGRKPERYSANTVNGWLRVLRTMLNDARRLRGLRDNVATAVRPLKEAHDLEETNSLNATELSKVLNALRDAKPEVMMAAWTQAFTGLRWGEVSALKWEDLDMERRILLIRRKVQKGQLVPSTKTKKIRRVAVAEELLNHLVKYRVTLVGIRASCDLMFPSSVGKPIYNSRISEALLVARKKAGITKRFTSQGFRRSLTDLLREGTVDPVVAKAITGHSTDRMREHYSTVREDDLRKAGDAVGAQLLPQLRLVGS